MTLKELREYTGGLPDNCDVVIGAVDSYGDEIQDSTRRISSVLIFSPFDHKNIQLVLCSSVETNVEAETEGEKK